MLKQSLLNIKSSGLDVEEHLNDLNEETLRQTFAIGSPRLKNHGTPDSNDLEEMKR